MAKRNPWTASVIRFLATSGEKPVMGEIFKRVGLPPAGRALDARVKGSGIICALVREGTIKSEGAKHSARYFIDARSAPDLLAELDGPREKFKKLELEPTRGPRITSVWDLHLKDK